MKASLGVLILCLATASAFAEVQKVKPKEGPYGIMLGLKIHGEITQADVQAVQSYVDLERQLDVEDGALKFLVLDSEGGDLDAALKIGRIIRGHGYLAQVQPTGRCLSACVYILAAAQQKQVLGKVGVHRPYFGKYAGKNAGKEISVKLQESKQFFREVNIPDSLAELMFSTPPAEMKILNADELRLYRLDQDDIEYAENSDIEAAKSLGVSRADYMRFKRELNYKCKIYMGDQPGMMKCLESARRDFLSTVQKEGE